MTIFEKLHKEWKTFALSISVTFVGLYDVIVDVARQYGYDYTQLIKSEYRMYVIPAFAVGMLALRKWTSSATLPEPEVPDVPEVPEVPEPEVK